MDDVLASRALALTGGLLGGLLALALLAAWQHLAARRKAVR